MTKILGEKIQIGFLLFPVNEKAKLRTAPASSPHDLAARVGKPVLERRLENPCRHF
jgi:hypothetical protein